MMITEEQSNFPLTLPHDATAHGRSVGGDGLLICPSPSRAPVFRVERGAKEKEKWEMTSKHARIVFR